MTKKIMNVIVNDLDPPAWHTVDAGPYPDVWSRADAFLRKLMILAKRERNGIAQGSRTIDGEEYTTQVVIRGGQEQ